MFYFNCMFVTVSSSSHFNAHMWKHLICLFLYCFKFLFQFQPFFTNKSFLRHLFFILTYHHEIEIQKHSFCLLHDNTFTQRFVLVIGVKVPITSSVNGYTKVLAHNLNSKKTSSAAIG